MAVDQQAVQYAIRAARATGADPLTFLASGLVESGFNPGAVGDQGSSFGAYQWHRGGALGSHDPAWTRSYAAYLERARAFAAAGSGGAAAAAAQRPADPSGYAQKVDAAMAQARQLMAGNPLSGAVAGNEPGIGGTTATSPMPTGTAATLTKLQRRQGLLDTYTKTTKTPQMTLPAPATLKVELDQPPTPHNPNPTRPSDDELGTALAEGAKQFLGVKYVWGGEDPSGFDCSGLMQYVYKRFGINIPRVSQEQFNQGTPVDPTQMRPGDLVFFHPGANGPGHVGLAIGNGQFIQAPKTGDVVKISDLASRSDLVGVRRYR